ncbi:MAG: Arm DNA-binding domain-containing protein [Janthinobacterium lividum]
MLRYTLSGQRSREMSLGSETNVTLAEARERASKARREMDAGHNHTKARSKARQEAAGNAVAPTY